MFADIENKDKNESRIIIKGVSSGLLKNIKARLPSFKPTCSADLSAVEKYKKAIKKKLDKSTRSLGYYQSNYAINATSKQKCWIITVEITPGKPVLVNKQDIEITGAGRNETAFHTILKTPPYKIKEPLNHQYYSNYKTLLTETAQELGYLEAEFETKQILIDLPHHSASIRLHFKTGNRFRYGKIIVEQDILSTETIDKFLELKEGEYFSSNKLIHQQQLLQNSGYYSVVNIRPDFEAIHNGVIPIKITLVSRRRTGYLARFGYGTDTGLRAKGTMERRWTGGSGKKLRINVGLSQRINDLNIQLEVPKNDPENNSLFYTLGWKQDENDDVDSESFNAGVLSTSIRSNDWKRTLSLNYLDDKTQVVGGSVTRSRLTLLGIKYSHVEAESRLFPDKGWRLGFEAEGAVDKLLSDASILQLRAHGKYIHKLGEGRLLARADFGTTYGDSLDNLPKDLRFFAGGNNSIRGFSYESLGEINSEGKVIGGKQLIETSLEYEYPIAEKWNIAGFVDTGNAFDEFKLAEVETGVGAGIRWHSPIGPVRLDFAWPAADTSDLHLHLSIGPDL